MKYEQKSCEKIKNQSFSDDFYTFNRTSFLSLKKMDAQQTHPILTLIYHNFRGMAQLIRYVLLFLQLPFEEILLGPKQNLFELDVIKNAKIYGTVELPCLVHGTKCIQSFFAMVRYLCTLAGRQDLLGQNLEQRTLIRQVFYNFLLGKKQEMKLFFSFGQKALQSPQNKEKIRKIVMDSAHEISQCAIPLVKLRLKNMNQKYIFDHITLLDFMLFEQSFYQLNLFGNLQAKNCAVLDVINSLFKTDLYKCTEKSSFYLRLMRQFRDTFEKEQFYVKNKEKLESYTMICPNMGKLTVEGFRNVWLGPQSYLK